MAGNNKNNSGAGKPASGSGSGKNSGGGASNYATVKEGWGSHNNFMASYGLKPEPGAYEEARAILDGFREHSGAGGSGGASKGNSNKK